MQEHHRKLIEAEAEAEKWKADAKLFGTQRSYKLTVARGPRPNDSEPPLGVIVTLTEELGSLANTTTRAFFGANETPLSPRMVRARFSNPFGAAK